MSKLEQIYTVLKEQKPELSKRAFSTDYLGASSGYMTTMSYYNREASLKALAHLRSALAIEVEAWEAISATHNTERATSNLEKARRLHAIATETLLEVA